MIQEELKKILLKQKVIWIIGIAILFKCIFVLFDGFDSEILIDSNIEEYNEYIGKYGGKLTEDKIKEFKKEELDSDFVLKDIAKLDQEKKENRISQEDYVEHMEIYMKRLNNAQIFDLISSKYQYSIVDVNNRFIMDERGWKTILAHNNPDIVYIILIIFISAIVFTIEYEAGMHLLDLSMKKGKKTLFNIKVIVSLILMTVSTLVFTLIEWVIINSMVGLHGGSYPLQSIQYFKLTEYNVSIIEAFVLVCVLRLFGGLLLISVIAAFSSIIRNSIPVVILSMIFIYSPLFLISHQDVLYRIPLPTGLICSEGFLFGTQFEYRENINRVIEKIVEFQAVKPIELFYLVGCSLLLSLVLLLVARRKYNYVS